MFELTGRVALVAGGAGYLGRSVCEKLAEQGAAVMCADIRPESAEEVARDISRECAGGLCEAVGLNIADEQASADAVRRTVDRFGRLDILVNATFASANERVDDFKIEDFDTVMHVNLSGAFALAREAARSMTNGGSIIMFSSVYGMMAPDPPSNPNRIGNPIAYGVSKAGVSHLVKYLAVYWAEKNIRVNAVVPGFFPHLPDGKMLPDHNEVHAHRVPLGRGGGRYEIAGPVVFLASDESSYVTGQSIVVDGGWTCWH